jgi:hypothetical protein
MLSTRAPAVALPAAVHREHAHAAEQMLHGGARSDVTWSRAGLTLGKVQVLELLLAWPLVGEVPWVACLLLRRSHLLLALAALPPLAHLQASHAAVGPGFAQNYAHIVVGCCLPITHCSQVEGVYKPSEYGHPITSSKHMHC